MLLHLASVFLVVLTGLMNRAILKGLQLSYCGVDSCLLHSVPPTLHSHIHRQYILRYAACYPSSGSTLSLTLHWNLAQAAWVPDQALSLDLTPSHLQPLSLLSSTYSGFLLGGSLCFWGDSWCVTPGSQPLHGPWFPTALGPAEERVRAVPGTRAHCVPGGDLDTEPL